MKEKLIDHLFRHQYGKMVAILTRIFGLNNLQTIEDAVQDTFVMAMQNWRVKMPENPEAWLTKAAKNRAIDLLRKLKADSSRFEKLTPPSIDTLDDFFLEHEIEDSQLRMIFTACHPDLDSRDQIAFALKTIAGFSTKEIAAALLLKVDTVKKRLARARKAIKVKGISFSLPQKHELLGRLGRVHEILYLIFNEGFHSTHPQMLIRKDLCGEALRLTRMVLQKEELRTAAGYGLFALMCYHSARLESKIDEKGESISLKKQDRKKWYIPLILLGNGLMRKAMQYDGCPSYYIEASIAAEHLKAKSFESTNWDKILDLYKWLYTVQNDAMTALNIAVVLLQLDRNEEALEIINQNETADLEQRAYLFYGVKAEYYKNIGQSQTALACIDLALEKVTNEVERAYLVKKREKMAQ